MSDIEIRAASPDDADVGAELVPLMHVREVEPDEYFINNVAALPRFQGEGLRTLLMELAERKANDAALDKCALTVAMENSRAVGLYQHLGYQIVETVEVRSLEVRVGSAGLYRMMKILE